MLGELLAQYLGDTCHIPVERRFYLAGTYICQQALLAGRIDSTWNTPARRWRPS